VALSNNKLKRLCVLSDLNSGVHQRLEASAIRLAVAMAEANIGLVCRGGVRGLISIIAKTSKEHGGHVTCVAPRSCGEQMFEGADEYLLSDSLHECKMLLFDISDGFVVLPGGVVTLEVLMEYLTWIQRIHQSKPVFIIDLEGYWRFLFKMFEHMRHEAFLPHNFDMRYILLDDVINVVPNFQSQLSKRSASEALLTNFD
jgi:hypothetical protein